MSLENPSSHNVNVQDVDYNKGNYATSAPVATTAYTSNYAANPTTTAYASPYTNNAAANPTSAAAYSDYNSLSRAVPNVCIFLRPIAAPSTLGWMSFFAGTFMVFTYNASWYGNNLTYIDLATFVFVFGGICQLVAGFKGYAARDNFVTVWFTLWGSFFVAWAYYTTFVFPTAAAGNFDKFGSNSGLAMWFVILAAGSWICLLPALARDITTGVIVLLAAIGATLELAYFSNRDGRISTIKAGAYFLIASSLVALFRSWLYLLEEAFFEQELGSRFNPSYRTRFQGDHVRSPVCVGVNEPGVRKGQ